MRSLAAALILGATALLMPSCTAEAGPADGAETTVKLCCKGSCGAPEGYCCNPETFCAGACPSDSKAWDAEAKAAAADAAADGTN